MPSKSVRIFQDLKSDMQVEQKGFGDMYCISML